MAGEIDDGAKGGIYGGTFDSSGLDANIRAVMVDLRWTTSFGGDEAATVISYAFPTTTDAYLNTPGGYPVDGGSDEDDDDGDDPFAGFTPLTDIQVDAVRSAFGLVSLYTNLTFQELDSSEAANATFRFGNFTGTGSFSGFPPNAGSYSPQDYRTAADTWLGGNGNPPTATYFGTDHFNTIMHEMGHAFGLKHGHDPSLSGALSDDRNDNEFAVMTYASYFGADTEGATEAWVGSAPQSYMMYDIAALQAYYGANFSKVGTAAVYTWDALTGQQYINGEAAPFTGASETGKIFSTVWTQGATATYDLSNFADDQFADLRPGQWLRFSSAQIADLNDAAPEGTPEFQAQGNIYNALLYNGDTRSLVSNLITGSGNDRLIGNDADNLLSAGAGIDTIEGGIGNDTISGGAGEDVITFGAGRSLLRDTLADLDGDRVLDLGFDNAVQILGIRAARDSVLVTTDADGVAIGLDGGSFHLAGDFAGGDFVTAMRGLGDDAFTHLSFIPYLPALSEEVTVDAGAINGIADDMLLQGDGLASFTVTLDGAVTGYRNTIGSYRIAPDGTISDVSILFGNASDDAMAGSTSFLGTPLAGESIAFFLIQDGDRAYGALPDDLSFRWADDDTGWVLHSASAGDLADAAIFHSIAAFNPDAATHVLSGLAPGSDGLWIGFEDEVSGASDNDFQDVVLTIREYDALVT
ncbi:DUF4114 domain-containing protein [Roseomonas sp. HJA6]|uniref:DUF4114 domain-containing protein n=1 Tax=Roseomonas alba TaxID=2846776 RepID=A0ABS7A3V8_9PROT|nr:DUF4114 domain-containing protein [Neoroseomonas alba]MBW6396966.1 DUF4114 domain-containing protein [Neoroseomonas alba]